MRAEDAEEICRIAQVDPVSYSVGAEHHESLCLIDESQSWHVFLSERGGRFEEMTFESEDDACVYFLKRLFELTRHR